jgi:hypothetical protein
MSLRIEKISAATSAEWDLAWRGCDYATYFHSREWSEIWAECSGGRMTPSPLLVSFSDGARALLPLAKQKSVKNLVTSYISSPGTTYGGWISAETLGAEHASLLVSYMSENLGNLNWRLNPYDRLPGMLSLPAQVQDETHAVDLSVGIEEIRLRWKKSSSVDRKARKALKEGVSVRPAGSLDEWLAYYDVYLDSLNRWGENATSRYDWELFEEISRRNSKEVKLWLSFYDGKVIAGALCFYAKRHAVYWHGAALQEYFNLRAVNLLMCQAIEDACLTGYSWFDFNPSGGHDGVTAFKRSFGAVPLPAPVLTLEKRSTALLKKVSSNLKRMVT